MVYDAIGILWSLAAVLAVMSVMMLHPLRRQHESVTQCFTWNPSVVVVLQLMTAALREGASIPEALRTVAYACGGSTAEAYSEIAEYLEHGVPWDDAWQVESSGTVQQSIAIMREALRVSWMQGASAVTQMQSAIQRIDTSMRMTIERDASTLSVRLLLPMGLCFLPAFLCIAVIPTIMSFAQQ